MTTLIPALTVRTATDVQTAATTRFLDRAGVDYLAVPTEESSVTVTHVSGDGTVRTWTGFRPDRLKEAVAEVGDG